MNVDHSWRWRLWASLLFLSLSGCAHIPAFLRQPPTRPPVVQPPVQAKHILPPPPLPTPSAGIKALLNYAGEVAGLPLDRQQTACEQAKTHFAAHPSDYSRMTLAMLATVIPDCLSPDGSLDLLRSMTIKANSPYRGLAMILRQLTQQRQATEKALAASNQEAETLRQKLKALTRIETQLNQVKDRELQNLN